MLLSTYFFDTVFVDLPLPVFTSLSTRMGADRTAIRTDDKHPFAPNLQINKTTLNNIKHKKRWRLFCHYIVQADPNCRYGFH
ncbi:MAG: hypothetical protein GX218_00885 [Clostridiaceae bacterium]|nr:hypothetical protein [Clostridiaceae bacterium]